MDAKLFRALAMGAERFADDGRIDGRRGVGVALHARDDPTLRGIDVEHDAIPNVVRCRQAERVGLKLRDWRGVRTGAERGQLEHGNDAAADAVM